MNRWSEVVSAAASVSMEHGLLVAIVCVLVLACSLVLR
jgi:hypothetical protein